MKLVEWGLIDYETSVHQQMALVESVANEGEEQIVFCSHPPVVTLGRAADATDMQGWKGSIIESSRGGRATYHGPNQLVIYPILDLRRTHKGFGERDIHAYLRSLEQFVVKGLKEIGIKNCEARTTEIGGQSLTGVWVGEQKIASIGIAVRKWITYHGVAINLLEDPSAFKGIRPCGFEYSVMTSVEGVLCRKIDPISTREIFITLAADSLS